VTITPGASVNVQVPALEAQVVAPTPAPHPAAGGTQRAAGLVTIGVGVAGVAVGTIAGLQSMSKKSDGDKNCVGDICNAQGVSDRDDALTAGNVSTIAFVVGGAAIAGGVLLYLLAPKTRSGAATGLGLTPTAHAGQVGLGGAFW
jgi:serine/threonine-protein kinase